MGFWSPAPHEARFCYVILTPDDRRGHRADQHLVVVKPGTLTVSSSTSSGTSGGEPAGRFIMGVAPPGTTSVRLEPESGGKFDALFTDAGPESGYRYFGVFFEGDQTIAPTVIALYRSGAELARARE